MLASDDNNREFAGAMNPDGVLFVQFYMKATPNNFETNRQQKPIFQTEPFIKIMVPGRNDLTVDRPIEPGDDHRFPRQWMVFKNMTADASQIVGTPVEEWPQLTRSQAEELRAKKFYTVEQVAGCSDDQIASLGMNANILRTKARQFLSVAKDTASAVAAQEALQARDAELASLREEMAALKTAVLAGATKSKPAKVKREMSPEAREAAAERMRKMHADRAAAKAQQV